ncbi:MAG: hypothetical protein A2289_21060 [Deltaproteobacteria bacterium RIFOXYA12_FULL_58_15]|nr:MAG: hypothetical protein A2289_21060 [Deltaproteobacteria bacterium RIFOXYA12_FULL_58_15]
MNTDKLTQKANEALLQAQTFAAELGQQAVEVEHLLKALIEQDGGVVSPLLKKIGVSADVLLKDVENAARRLPKVQGGEPYLGRSLSVVMSAAQKQADELKDDYVSTEHLLLAAAQSKGPASDVDRQHKPA